MPVPRRGFAALSALVVTTLATGALDIDGETPATALPIPSLPFTAEGSTTPAHDDFDVACPYTGSNSPDVFYSYTGTGEILSIDLCNSDYDTKTYVLDSNLQLVETVLGGGACNDDFCTSPNGAGFRSFLSCVPADGLVIIAVDGSRGDRSSYRLAVRAQVDGCDPCPADLDHDGAVGFTDVLAVLSSWGPCAHCDADFDKNGTVDFTDLLAVLALWGPC